MAQWAKATFDATHYPDTIFMHPELGRRRIILIDAWRKFLPMHGNPTPHLDHEMIRPGDTPAVVRAKNARWRHRVGHEWGLVEWVAETCRAWGVQKLLIEGKSSGITAAQELQRLTVLSPCRTPSIGLQPKRRIG
jgi:hypothetical protein